MRFFLVFLFDVFFAGMAQAALTLGLTTASALLGILLTVCKIIVSHRLFIFIMTLCCQNQHFYNVVKYIKRSFLVIRLEYEMLLPLCSGSG